MSARTVKTESHEFSNSALWHPKVKLLSRELKLQAPRVGPGV